MLSKGKFLKGSRNVELPYIIKTSKSDSLLKRIAGPHRPFSVAGEAPEPTNDNNEAKTRRTNLNIEKWLKAKFREGFKDLNQAMKTYDVDDTGRINRKDFRFGSKAWKIYKILGFIWPPGKDMFFQPSAYISATIMRWTPCLVGAVSSNQDRWHTQSCWKDFKIVQTKGWLMNFWNVKKNVS